MSTIRRRRQFGAAAAAVALMGAALAAASQEAGTRGTAVLGPIREIAILDRAGADAEGVWTASAGQNIDYSLSPRRAVPGLRDPVLELRGRRKSASDGEPGHNWMSLKRAPLPDGLVPAGLDGFRFTLGSRGEAQWWINATLTTSDGDSYSALLADHVFPADYPVSYSVPLGRFRTGTGTSLTPEKARDLRGISLATSTPGTTLFLDRVAAYRREPLPGWLDFTTSHPATNLFQRTDAVAITFTPGGAMPPPAVGFRYEVRDFDGRVAARGAARLTGAPSYAFAAAPHTHGYYEVRAYLVDAAGKDVWPFSCIRAEGSVPDGLGTFSVLPGTIAGNIARFRQLGENAFFGLHGDFLGLADSLGLAWRFGYTGWQYLEPTRPDRSSGEAPWVRTALAEPAPPDYQVHILPFTLNLGAGTPAWARNGSRTAPGFAWEDALAMVRDSVRVEKGRYPRMKHRLYGALWEANLNAPPYSSQEPPYTPADIAEAYRRVREVVKADDPQGLVIGPCSSVIRPDWFEAAFNAGTLRYVDGIETHGYAEALFTPEANDYPGKLASLNTLVRTYTGGRALPIYVTEAGQPGVLGDEIVYRSQAQRMARLCIILKGEGVRVFLPFYGIDYDRAGYWGFLYNLDIDSPSGPWAIKRGSPKPMANAVAACAMLLEGASPAGRLRTLGPDVWAYRFRRGDTTIAAAWTPKGTRAVALPVGSARTVQVVDIMGHARSVAPSRGAVPLTVDESPVYVVWREGPPNGRSRRLR